MRKPPILPFVLAFLCSAPVFADTVLRVDLNDVVEAVDTAPGFTAYTFTDETLPVPPFSVTINPAGGAALDDVRRATPPDGGALTLAPLYRDSMFVAADSSANFYRIGLDAVITGLGAGKKYTVTGWSYDSGSGGTRVSDWSVAGLGGPWFGVNNYAFDGASLPASDSAHRFTITSRADQDGRLVLRGRQSGTASAAQVFLNGFTIEEHDDPAAGATPVLALDFNDRGGAGNTAPGFEAFLLAGSEGALQTGTTRTFGDLTVGLAAVGTSATMDDRLRTTPSNTAGFTEALLLRDFVFGTTSTEGLDVRLQGLEPGREYLVEVWSFDTGSPSLRTSRWTVNGAMLWDDYQFNGANGPVADGEYKMAGAFVAALNGELLISGRLVSGSPAVFLNALRVSILGDQQVVDLGGPILSEFIADNQNGATDEDGAYSDWIEIWNATPDPLDLAGWHLTDDPADLGKWTFPAGVILPAQARLVVWASGKDRRSDPARLHTNFALDKGGGAYLALVRPNRIDIATEYSDLPTQRTDISYGLSGSTLPLTEGYFATPTPGGPNGSTVPGFVADTRFTPNRGFFASPFHAQITTATNGAVIHYTTDGSEPTEASATYPGGAGIPINTTTVLRAKAFLPPLSPTDVDTQTYIFNAHVAAQPANPAGWPATWGIDSEVNNNDGARDGTVPADYAMDSRVVNNTQPGYSVPEALAALPVMSITLDPAGFHSAATGIHSNPKSVGDQWERPASVELINPDGSGFHERAGIRVHGNSSRRPYRMQKHSFRLAFRNVYGAGKLKYRLFKDTKVDSFDRLVLRACFTDSWGLVSWDSGRYRPDDSVTFRDVWVKQSHADMGYPATSNIFVHLYVNGLYWGIYNPSERMDDVFAADHFGGQESDWDVIADFNELKAGNRTAWNQMFTLASAGLVNQTNYEAIQQQLDVASFADYYLLHIHADAEDWPSHNWYAIRNRNVAGDKWRWLVWDQEIVLDNHSINRIGATNANTPGALLQALRQNAEFRLLFADRAHRHLFNNGALSLAACQNRWQALAAKLDKAIVAESARWGDTASSTPYGNTPSKLFYTREADWLPTVSSVRNTYLPSLYNEANSYATIRKLRAASLYPATAAPAFAQHGGNVPQGYTLAMAAPAGTIYYTLDGSDPREALTGNPAGAAYTGPVALTQTGVVKARARSGAEWSALTEAQFIVGIAAGAAHLAVAELHYHPALSEEHEFIELVNRSTDTIDLTGVHFTAGVTFTFPQGLLLAPGARILVVRNITAFEAQYGTGFPIAGQYEGALDNSGETIALAAADGTEILRFNYDDAAPWPTAPDTIGRSLVLRSPTTDPTNPLNWRSSVAAGGTPGGSDSVALTGSPLADDDRDGLIALLEHAFGSSDSDAASAARPFIGMENFTTGSGPQPFLTITAFRNLAADDTLLTGEYSSDMETWQSGQEGAAVFLGESVGPDGKAMLKWRAPHPASGVESPQFLRIRVLLTP